MVQREVMNAFLEAKSRCWPIAAHMHIQSSTQTEGLVGLKTHIALLAL
jgi:hypothetical protein